jgi:soluble lytic murein transglycosylase-like protein
MRVNGKTLMWVVLGGSVLAYLARNQVDSGVDDVTAVIAGWKNVQQGSTWVPVINQTESAYGIPPDLLARMAYQESHFRPDIISGTLASPAGALGILQLMPQYFNSVNVPRPYQTADVVAQITEAAQQLQRLYGQFQDWGIAVAAYNAGAGTLNSYLAGTRQLPAETVDYVTSILADVPVATSLQA